MCKNCTNVILQTLKLAARDNLQAVLSKQLGGTKVQYIQPSAISAANPNTVCNKYITEIVQTKNLIMYINIQI